MVFSPKISGRQKTFHPRNIMHMPGAKMFACLDFERKSNRVQSIKPIRPLKDISELEPTILPGSFKKRRWIQVMGGKNS
jgi:hypothetical protein